MTTIDSAPPAESSIPAGMGTACSGHYGAAGKSGPDQGKDPGTWRPLLAGTNGVIAAVFATCWPLAELKAGPAVQDTASPAESTIRFDIPAQDLAPALGAFTRQSRVQFLYEGDLAKNLRSAPVNGAYPPVQALQILLTGTPLQSHFTGPRTVTLKRKSQPVELENPSGNATLLGKVTVSAKATTGYDPNDPYDQTYAIANSTSATKTDTPIMDTPVSVQVEY
ncbi:MAG: secretin and TonB N-terminal domain-containing protein [Methylococcaceae bacterium]|nr:secretin and TonB N-terminal domain-containing protein [Methylococcaceae bacterium]